MRARPEDLRPPCFQSSRSRPRPPSRGNTPSTRSPAAPKTRVLEGHLHLNKDRGRSAEQNEASIAGRSSAAAAAVVVVVVPSLPLPATPTPPTNSPTPPDQNALHLNSGRREECEPNTAPASPSSRSRPLAPEEEEESREREEESVPEQDWELQLGPAGSERSPPATPLSHGSLSDLSRPPSSLFSRSTHLTSGRSSVLSAFSGDSDPEGSGCFSPPRPSPAMRLPLTTPPPPPPASNPPRSSMSTTTNSTDPPLYEPLFGQAKPHHAYRSTSRLRPNSVEPLSHCESAKTPESLQRRDACVDPGLDPSLDSSRGLGTLAFPSTTWSSCPSPQMTTPCSGSGAELTPSPPLSRLESRRWSILPPISPVRGRCGSEVSRYSELSCSGSRVFDELDAIAPRSTSGASLDLASDSSGCTSPGTELSPGLAALTMGCDSGNLGSLSRVQLLLLGRPEPECLPSPCGLEEEEEEELEQDWSAFRMRYDPGLTSEGVLRPLTAGGVSERCDSAGKVQGNKSDQSEGGSGSPSSWIIDPSPSYGMFRPSRSPCPSNHSCGPDEGGPPEKESNYPGWRDPVGSPAGGRSPESLEHRNEDKERRIMEERRNKVLNVLSRLQEDTPRRGESSKGCCNFEDFDFLAKYCIFSQEKLDEYKRAFEAEDSDGDGYISCVQVLLALKNIIPPELLSDEEEIYVCRILEMVDFRVTDGLVDLRLFSVIASLAQKIASMDDFMRSLISSMDFRSLEVRLFKAKRLFLFLLEERRGDAGSRQGFIGAEQLLLELKAGGIRLEQEAAVRLQLQRFPPLDLLGFLAYLPLFMLVHKSIIANPLDDSGHH